MPEIDPSATDDGQLPAQVRWSSGFVGRHRQLRAIHDILCADGSPAVVVIMGRPGIGKSSLAARYAHIRRDAYPGGIFWTGPFGHHAPEDFLSRFHLELARVVTDEFGLDVRGTPLGVLRRLMANRLSGSTGKALLIIDDLPADLPRSVLDQLLISSRRLSMVLTSRAERSAWRVPTIELGGLTLDEGSGLLSEEKVRDGLAGLEPAELAVLRVAAALAPVPIPGELIAEVLGLAVEPPMPLFTEMADGGWQVHDMALGVLREDPALLAVLARQAVPVLLDWLDRHRGDRPDFLIQHAEAVAEWAVPHRARLLRPSADAFEEQGDLAAAGEIRARILTSHTDRPEDLVAAARVELGCGLQAEAVRHARKAAELAEADPRVRRRAKLIAARALDELGRYSEADREFWAEHAAVAGADVPDEESFRLVLATAVAYRLRGRPGDAVALLEPMLGDPRGEFAEIVRRAKLECARSLPLSGRPRKARVLAGEVVDAYLAAGRGWHPDCAEAEAVHAEATLALDLAELKPGAPVQEWSAFALRKVKARYEESHGRDHPLTLAAAVRADRALLAHGQTERALVALAATERDIVRVLGEEHPLRCRTRHGMGLAHGMLHEFGRQADVLDSILEPQIRLLGAGHPETVESHLDLAVALVLCDREPRERAIALVVAAERSLTATQGPDAKLAAKVLTAKWVVQLPKPLLSAMVALDRLP